MKTKYMVVLKPLIEEEGDFYTLDTTKTLCYTRYKLLAWIVFIVRGWKMKPDHDIQIITLRPF